MFSVSADTSEASMGPRSSERGNSAESAKSPRAVATLQWGRARLSAETMRPRATRCSASPASMGPRSSERGNWPDDPSPGCGLALQWGRARLSAEIVQRRYGEELLSGFNGAALVERGNGADSGLVPDVPGGFNGAALV